MRHSVNTARELLLTTEKLKEERLFTPLQVTTWVCGALFMAMFLYLLAYSAFEGVITAWNM